MCGAVCIVYYQAALALRGAAAHRASLDLLVIEQQVSSQPAAAVSQSVSHMHFGHLALPVKSPPALAGMQSSSMIQGLSLSRFYHSLTGGQILNPPLKLRFVVPKPNFESNSNPLFSRTPTYLFFTNFPLYKALFGSTQFPIQVVLLPIFLFDIWGWNHQKNFSSSCETLVHPMDTETC